MRALSLSEGTGKGERIWDFFRAIGTLDYFLNLIQSRLRRHF